jgi:hypothetical protein
MNSSKRKDRFGMHRMPRQLTGQPFVSRRLTESSKSCQRTAMRVARSCACCLGMLSPHGNHGVYWDHSFTPLRVSGFLTDYVESDSDAAGENHQE